MKNLEKGLFDFAKILEKAKEESKVENYALIGALAVSTRGRPRATEDIDFLVSAEKDFLANEFPETVRSMGHAVKVFKGEFNDPIKGLIRVYDKEGRGFVDIIPVFWKWQDEMLKGAEYLPLKDISIPVVRTEDLIILKLKAGGPQDILDAEELLKVTHLDSCIDKERLFSMAKKTRVDKNLERLLARLKIAL